MKRGLRTIGVGVGVIIGSGLNVEIGLKLGLGDAEMIEDDVERQRTF